MQYLTALRKFGTVDITPDQAHTKLALHKYVKHANTSIGYELESLIDQELNINVVDVWKLSVDNTIYAGQAGKRALYKLHKSKINEGKRQKQNGREAKQVGEVRSRARPQEKVVSPKI